MTKKKTSALREMGQAELLEKVVLLRAEMARERAINASGTRPENPGKIRKTRRELARTLTIIAEKKRVAEKAKAKPVQKIGQKKIVKTEAKSSAKPEAKNK